MRIPTPLLTARLHLRTLTEADATSRYLAWMQNPEVTQYLESRWAQHDHSSLVEFIQSCNESSADLLLGICLGDRHIGNIKLGPINSHHRNAAVGLLIGEQDCWGQGYAAEAIAAITEHGFKVLGLEKIYAGCYASNIGSCRAFIRAGYVEEARQKAHWDCAGRREDNVMLGYARADWAAGQT